MKGQGEVMKTIELTLNETKGMIRNYLKMKDKEFRAEVTRRYREQLRLFEETHRGQIAAGLVQENREKES